MRLRECIVFLCVSILGVPLLSAGLVPLVSARDFSPTRTSLNFGNLVPGASVGQALGAWGVSIESADGDQPFAVADLLGGQPVIALSNANDGASQNAPLIVNLRRPARQMGFTLRNGSSSTMATISAFDNQGRQVGEFVVDHVNRSFGPFVGFETTEAGESFSKVLIDYGDAGEAEQILDLEITFLQRPFFTSFLAQVADGMFGGNTFQTTVIVTNLANTTAQGEIQFMGDDGEVLDIALRDTETGESFSPAGFGGASLFPIRPFSSRSFTTSGLSSPTIQAYAEIRSSAPVATTAVFRAIVNGTAFEAGVGGTTPRHRISAAVSREASGFDSGIAVANPNAEAVQASLQLISRGAVVAFNDAFLSLAPGQHVAAFLPELFPDIEADFRGSILIRSPLPLVATVLRTAAGIVSSSLPAGGTEP